MGDFVSAKSFLVWLTSAAGLGVAVPFVMQAVKKYLPLEGWQAFLLTACVAIFLGGGATVLLEYGAFDYVEPYWDLIVAIISVVAGGGVALGSSQLVYHLAPRTGDGENS